MPDRRSPTLPSDHLQPVVRLARRALRFWRTALAVFAASSAIIGAVVLLWPRQYRSETTLHYREGMQWTTDEVVSSRRVVQRLREIVLSRSRLAKVVEELGLYPKLVRAGREAEAVEEMRLATGFRFDQSDVFVISFAADSPELAQRVTAKLAELLIEENQAARGRQAELAKDFLDVEKKRKAEEVAVKEVEQMRFLAKNPEFALEQSTGVGVTLRARQNREAVAAAPQAAADLRAAQQDGHQPAQRGPQQDPALAAAKNAAESRLTAALRELADRRARLTEQHPDTRAAAANAAEAEQAYRRAVSALEASQGSAQGNGAAAGAGRPAAARAPAPSRPAPQSGPAANRTVALETEWARLTREVTEARERLQNLDNQQFKASMNATMLTSGGMSQIAVIDPAYLPSRPIGVRPGILLLMGVAASLAIAICVALALGLLDDLVYDPWDVERLEITRVLAEVTGRSMQRGEAGGDGSRAAAPWRLPGLGLLRRLALPAPGGGTAGGAGPHDPAPPAVEVTISGGTPIPEEAPAAEADGSQVPAGDRRGPAAELVIQVVDSRGDKAPGWTRLISFENDFSGAGGTAPAGARAAGSEGTGDGAADPGAPSWQTFVRIHRAEPPCADGTHLLMLSERDAAAAASFRVLRHRLGERTGVKAILVTSPCAGEGKTLSAVNLALALGETGRARVLLIEANFRKPSVARVLGFRPPVGLGQQLAIHAARPEEPWDVVESVAPWLHVMAVAPESEADVALDGRALGLCIDELRNAGYDYVVVDSPAVLDGADVNLIEESVDGILMAMWARKSHARELRNAAAQIGSGKLLGVVLLGT